MKISLGENIIVHRLIRENGVKYYLPIAEAKIPLGSESVVRSRRIRSCFIDHTSKYTFVLLKLIKN